MWYNNKWFSVLSVNKCGKGFLRSRLLVHGVMKVKVQLFHNQNKLIMQHKQHMEQAQYTISYQSTHETKTQSFPTVTMLWRNHVTYSCINISWALIIWISKHGNDTDNDGLNGVYG